MNSGLFGLARAAFVGALQGLALPVPTANGFLKWNGTASGWELVPYGTAANTVAAGDDSRLAATAVTPASYGDATHVGQFTVGADGRITTAASVAISAGGGADPTASLEEIEDFISGTTTSGGIGKLGWAATNGSRQYVVPNDAGPGVLFFGTNGVANTPASIQMATPYVLLGGALFDVTIYTRPASADSTVTLRCGLMGDPTSDPPGGQGAYFEKLPADANWFGVTRQSGSQARTASLATNPNDGAFHRLRVRRIDAGNVGFSVDGGAEVVATTHLPVDELTVGYQIIATDTNTHNVNLDYVWLRVTGLSR